MSLKRIVSALRFPRGVALAFAIAAAIPNAALAFDPGDTVTVAALDNYAPYSDGELPKLGFSNDLIVTVLERAGYEAEIHIMPWSRAMEMARTGRYDILASAWRRKEREADFAFSDPIAVNEVAFVKRSGDPFEYNGVEDLEGKRVGVVREYSYDPAFAQADGFQRDEVYTLLTNLQKLHSGRIDLTLEDRLTVRHILNTEAPELADSLEITEGTLSRETLHIAVSYSVEGYEMLLADFNEALAEVRADGTYDALLSRHGID